MECDGKSGKLPFIGMFFSSFFFVQVFTPSDSATRRRPACLWLRLGQAVTPAYPFPHLACKLHDLHRNPQGGGGDSFQILDAVEFNVFCFLACPHPSSGRRTLLSFACECCSVSACSDSPNPFFSFPTANARFFFFFLFQQTAHTWHLYVLLRKKSLPVQKRGPPPTSFPDEI